jgi:hypothetical protein
MAASHSRAAKVFVSLLFLPYREVVLNLPILLFLRTRFGDQDIDWQVTLHMHGNIN